MLSHHAVKVHIGLEIGGVIAVGQVDPFGIEFSTRFVYEVYGFIVLLVEEVDLFVYGVYIVYRAYRQSEILV